jgi:hypothetical protein
MNNKKYTMHGMNTSEKEKVICDFAYKYCKSLRISVFEFVLLYFCLHRSRKYAKLQISRMEGKNTAISSKIFIVVLFSLRHKAAIAQDNNTFYPSKDSTYAYSHRRRRVCIRKRFGQYRVKNNSLFIVRNIQIITFLLLPT